MISAILFDLDGTLIDTAPDMGTALNNLLHEEGYAALPLDDIRPYVSQGGLALTRLGFANHVVEAAIEPLRQRYLQHYRAIVADESRLFNSMDELLDRLETRDIPWGIVTNKPEWLTYPLLEKIGLSDRAAVVIAGDTLEKRKPDPLPLLTAAERIDVNSEHCLYIGDDERDIVAGRAAGMKTLVAAYGYIQPGVDIDSWQADGVIYRANDLLGSL